MPNTTGGKMSEKYELDLLKSFSYNPETGILKRAFHYAHPTMAGRAMNGLDKTGYIVFMHKRKAYMAHRVCWFLHYKQWPKNQIDHINGNRSDNRILNLRDVTMRGNAINHKEHRSGKMPGTTYQPKKSGGNPWRSRIVINKVSHELGYFKTEVEAHEAYMKKAKELGEV
jgi:hypothetical protein